MGRSDIHLVRDDDEVETQFRAVMRRLAGGVAILTAGRDADIAGMMVTSVTALGADPPRLLVSVSRHKPPFACIARHGIFAINILGSDQQVLAGCFSDDDEEDRARFEGIRWSAALSGVPLLGDALATLECRVEEIIERHGHGIVIGSLIGFAQSRELSGLVYWNDQYIRIGHDVDLDLLAAISIPLSHVR